MGRLDGKVCLITGASRGIGRETVRLFAEEGAVAYANARTPGTMEGENVRPLYFDVRDEAAAKDAIARIQREQGRLDVLVNNAGVMKDALIGMAGTELMEEVFRVNVFAVMQLLQLAARVMRRQKSGSIINLSSIVGQRGNPGQLVYSASKGAVSALTLTAAKELAPLNIRVNAVAPGMIDTDMYRSIGQKRMESQLATIGLGRLGTPRDVAAALLFLASDEAGYITGEILEINGAALI